MNCCDHTCDERPGCKLTEADLDARIADKAPAPAEACTELGAYDYEPMTWRDLAWVICITVAAMTVGAMLAGYFVGLFTK